MIFTTGISHWTTVSALKSIRRFQTGKIDPFFRNLDPHNSRLDRKRVVFSDLSCLEVNEIYKWSSSHILESKGSVLFIVKGYI